MTAYLISDVSVRDEEAFQNYRSRAAPSIAKHGGRYLARGSEVVPLEGGLHPANIIVVEFPSLDQARAWYSSPEYAEALEFRDRAFTRNMIFVDGYALST